MQLQNIAQLIATGTLYALLCGCTVDTSKEEVSKVPKDGLLLRGAGATFPSVLYKRWFETYQREHPAVVIAYDAVGSGEGVRRFIGANVKDAEKVDFGASDAAMTDAELQAVPGGALLVPMTVGSVVLAYNLPDLGGQLKLSREALAGIFLAQIRRWDDRRIARANPGLKLPKLDIAIVVRQDASGTNFAFTKHLDAISETWRDRYGAATLVNWPGQAMRAKGNEGVAAQIQHSLGSIGYVGYEFARVLDLPVAQIENRAGKFVAPTEQSATASFALVQMPANMRLFVPDPEGSDSYPIVTFSWVLLYHSYDQPAKAKAIRDLFGWSLSEGQKEARALGYTPLPPNVTSRAQEILNSIGPD